MCVQIVQQMNFVRATNAKNACDGGGGVFGQREDTGPTCERVCECVCVCVHTVAVEADAEAEICEHLCRFVAWSATQHAACGMPHAARRTINSSRSIN